MEELNPENIDFYSSENIEKTIPEKECKEIIKNLYKYICSDVKKPIKKTACMDDGVSFNIEGGITISMWEHDIIFSLDLGGREVGLTCQLGYEDSEELKVIFNFLSKAEEVETEGQLDYFKNLLKQIIP